MHATDRNMPARSLWEVQTLSMKGESIVVEADEHGRQL
jgi:hypothetical protein